MVLKNQPQRRLGPYWDITGRRRRRFKTNAAWARTGALRADGEGESRARSSRLPASPHSLSHRTVFPSRLPVNFLYGAKWLWFYGFKEPTPTTLGPVLGHYGQTKKEVQNQRRLGPYGGITGRRRRRFKTNDAWARMEALRADGEEDSKPTTLGPVRRHYGRTERKIQNQRRLGPYGGITGRRRRRIKGTLPCLHVSFSSFVSP